MRARLSQLAVAMKYCTMAVRATRKQAREHGPIEAQVAARDGDARAAAGEHVELIEHAEAAAGGGGDGGAGDAEFRETGRGRR